MRRANGGAVPARTQRSLKNRGPGRPGCGQPRFPRLHRDTEGGRRGALRRVLTRRALGHWQIGMPCEDQSGARLQAARCSLLGPGDNAVELPRPGQTGPLPRRKAPGIPKVYPQRFKWFESTPRNAPRLPIQTNNHATSEPHTHVMSNENKFPLK